jgi:hypothetical protein
MKKTFCFSILLLITTMISISGQETNPKITHTWSVSLSVAPIATFYYYHGSNHEYRDYYSKGVIEVVYPTGTNLRIDRKLNDRLSISSGFNFKVLKHENLISQMGLDYYFEKSKDNKYIFEIPIDISYQILNSPKFFNPYLKTGLRNSYFVQSYFGEYSSSSLTGGFLKNFDIQNRKYIIFYDLGIGTHITLSRSISVMLESNLTYSLSGFGYLELQGGLRYSFK